MRFTQAGIPFEIVPGVTAGLGVTAYAGIPVTHRGAASAVAFVTGHGDPESEPGAGRLDWSALARFPGTLVVYMGVTHLAAICRTLMRLGKPGDTPAAVIEAGHSRRRKHTRSARLETIAGSRRERGCGPLLSWSSDPSSSLRARTGVVRTTAALRSADRRSRVPREEAVRAARRVSKRWVPKCCWRPRSTVQADHRPGAARRGHRSLARL